MLDVANRLAPKLGLDCEFRYLYGSRRAWAWPAHRSRDQDWTWGSGSLSVFQALDRFGVDPGEIKETLVAAGLPEERWRMNLEQHEHDALLGVLQHAEVRELISARMSHQRDVTVRYLVQEGLLDPEKKAVVDLGSQGTLQNALKALLADTRGEEPVGLYFCITGGPEHDFRHAYMLDERTNSGFMGNWDRFFLFTETFFVGDHGSVLRFTDDDDTIRPVLTNAKNQELIDWGLPIVWDTVAHFADALLLDVDLVNPWSDLRQTLVDVLAPFFDNPSAIEASSWGGFPWEEEGPDGQLEWHALASPYGWSDVIRTFRSGQIPRSHAAHWTGGSVALSSALVGKAIKLALKAHRRLRS